eukprot:354169-Chlamydomonas_euryale.AAC.25
MPAPPGLCTAQTSSLGFSTSVAAPSMVASSLHRRQGGGNVQNKGARRRGNGEEREPASTVLV